MRRNLAAPGLTYLDANRGRLVTIEDDVLGVKRKILDTYPELKDVYWDTENEEWVITEMRRDGTEEMVFATPALNDSVLERLHRADMTRRGQEDPLALIDAENSKIEAEMDRRFSDQIGDVGERLAFAFAQDGLTTRPRMVPISVPLRRKKPLPNYEAPR